MAQKHYFYHSLTSVIERINNKEEIIKNVFAKQTVYYIVGFVDSDFILYSFLFIILAIGKRRRYNTNIPFSVKTCKLISLRIGLVFSYILVYNQVR